MLINWDFFDLSLHLATTAIRPSKHMNMHATGPMMWKRHLGIDIPNKFVLNLWTKILGQITHDSLVCFDLVDIGGWGQMRIGPVHEMKGSLGNLVRKKIGLCSS